MKNEKDNVKTTTSRKRHKKQRRLVDYHLSLLLKPVKQPKSSPGQLPLFPAQAAVEVHESYV